MEDKKYKVRAPDGTILEFTGPSDATPEQIRAAAERAYSVSKGSAQPAPVAASSYFPASGSGRFFTPNMHRPEVVKGAREAAIPAARYGLPVIATLAGGPGAGALTIAGLGGLGGLAGSTMADQLEVTTGQKEQSEPRKIFAEAARSATPFRTTGSMGTRIGTNLVFSIGTQTAAQAIDGDGISFTEQTPGAALTTALSVFGRVGPKARASRQSVDSISKSRYGGTVALSELFPSLAKVEARRVANEAPLATSLVRDMDRDLAETLFRRYGNPPQDSVVTKEISQLVGKLKPLQKDAVQARNVARKAEEAAQAALKQGRLDAQAMMTKARQSAFEATKQKYLYEEGARALLGGKQLPLSQIAQGQRMLRLQEITKSAKDAARSGIDSLYGSVGIGINEPVVSYEAASRSLRSIRKGPLSGKDAKASIRAAFNKTFDTVEDGPRPPMTLERFRKFKQNLASSLAAEGKDANVANAIAAQAYKVLQNSSERYIKSNYGDDTLRAWNRANRATAELYGAKGADTIEAIAQGRSEVLLNNIKAEGWGPAKEQLEAFSSAIAKSGNPKDPASIAAAQEAARLFRRDVNDVIRDGVVDSAVIRDEGLDGIEAVDFKKLTQELQSLASKGFPIKQLGLGKPEEIASLARIAAKRSFSKDELSRFVQELPKVGRSAAEGRVEYFNELRKQTMKGGTRAAKTNSKLISARNRAKLKADEAEAMLAEVRDDPMVQLLNDTSMRLSKDATRNANWSGKLLAMDAEAVALFKDSMLKSGRADTMRRIEEGASANLIKGMIDQGADGVSTVNTEKLVRFFDTNEFKAQRDSLKALLGNEGFDTVLKTIVSPARRINTSRGAIVKGAPNFLETAGSAIRTKVPVPGGAAWYASAGRIVQGLYDRAAYRTFYTLFMDPRFAPAFADAGYNIDKFASQPVNAAMLKVLAADGEPSPAPAP
jgi:hypothetical protein